MEYTITIKEPKINQKIRKLHELHSDYIHKNMDDEIVIDVKNVLVQLLNSDDFEKLLDANIALFEVQG